MADPSDGDELDRPLGLDLDMQPRSALRYRRIVGAGCLALILAAAAGLYFRWDVTGGEPLGKAMLQAEPTPAPTAPTPPVAQVATPAADATASIPTPQRRVATATAEELENSNGVKVTRTGGIAPPGALIIEVPPDIGVQLTPAPDRRLIEKTSQGALPKIGSDGSRPADVYARPVMLPQGLRNGAPRIALLIGGMGLSSAVTNQAIDDLPGDVTLAFAPYGPRLESEARRARDAGHEILLQVPMESLAYPADDPGPQTLRAGETAAQNLTRLHWFMSRLPGYVGIVNFLGGKFTADRIAFEPVLREIADRGLLYVDDGTSTRSLTEDIGSGLALPLAQTDVVIDAVQKPEAIDAALARLEAEARRKGLAVGSATGLPVTLERVARWAHDLDKRGIALVPVSAAARQPRANAERVSNGG